MSGKSFFLEDSGGTSVELHPTWGFDESVTSSIRHTRTIETQLNSYRQTGNSLRDTLPLTNVTSADQTQISSWWQTQEPLLFKIQTPVGGEQIRTRIVNNSSPFAHHSMGVYSQYDGIIHLKSLNGIARIPSQQFILDSSSFGLLDNINIGLG